MSQLGSQAFLVAVMFWTLEATRSATTMGFYLAATTLPGVVLGPLAGAFVDRHSRKSILVAADFVRALAAAALALLVWTRPGSTTEILISLFAVAMIYGLSGALFQPAVAAAIPDLVTEAQVQQANSWIHASSRVAVLTGQAVGGVLFGWVGAAGLFAIDAVSYLLSAISECWIRLPRSSGSDQRPALHSYLHDARVGLELFWRDHGLRFFLLTTAGINFLFMPVFVLLPFYVTEVLEKGPAWYGFLLAAFSGGSLLGAILAGGSRWEGSRRGEILMAVLVAIPSCCVFLVWVGPAVALVLMAVLGVLTGLLNILVLSLVQLGTPAEFRGRILSLLISFSGAAMPLGMALGGIAGDLASVKQIFPAVSALGILYAGAMLTRRDLRDFLTRDPVSAAERASG